MCECPCGEGSLPSKLGWTGGTRFAFPVFGWMMSYMGRWCKCDVQEETGDSRQRTRMGRIILIPDVSHSPNEVAASVILAALQHYN
jgi:hypothetical protein